MLVNDCTLWIAPEGLSGRPAQDGPLDRHGDSEISDALFYSWRDKLLEGVTGAILVSHLL